MKTKNKKQNILIKQEQYLFKKIPNLNEHINVWNELEKEIDASLQKIIINKKQQKKYNQTDSALYNFTICLSGLLSLSMGLNYKSSSVYLSNDSDSTDKIKMRLLHNYFNIYSKEEYYEYFSQISKLKEPYDIAKTGLIFDLEGYKKMYQNFYDLNNEEIDEIDINFAFVNHFRPRISINFAFAYHLVETILLLRLGDDLNYFNHQEVVNLMPIFAIQAIDFFNDWKDFIKNYILAVIFVNLNVDNHLESIRLAKKLISFIPELIEVYALNSKDQWVKEIIKYEE